MVTSLSCILNVGLVLIVFGLPLFLNSISSFVFVMFDRLELVPIKILYLIRK